MNPIDLALEVTSPDRSLRDIFPVYAELTDLASAARNRTEVSGQVEDMEAALKDRSDSIRVFEGKADYFAYEAKADILAGNTSDLEKAFKLTDLAVISHDPEHLSMAEEKALALNGGIEFRPLSDLANVHIDMGDEDRAVFFLNKIKENKMFASGCVELAVALSPARGLELLEARMNSLVSTEKEQLQPALFKLYILNGQTQKALSALDEDASMKLTHEGALTLCEEVHNVEAFLASQKFFDETAIADRRTVSIRQVCAAMKYGRSDIVTRVAADQPITYRVRTLAAAFEASGDQGLRETLLAEVEQMKMTEQRMDPTSHSMAQACRALVAHGEIDLARQYIGWASDPFDRASVFEDIAEITHDPSQIDEMMEVAEEFLHNKIASRANIYLGVLESFPSIELFDRICKKLPPRFLGDSMEHIDGLPWVRVLAKLGELERAEELIGGMVDRPNSCGYLARFYREKAQALESDFQERMTAS